MNRRQMLTTLAGAAAAVGAKPAVEAIEAEPLPLALCLTTERPLSQKQIADIKETLRLAFREHPDLPIIILPPGMKLAAVRSSEITVSNLAKMCESIERHYRPSVPLDQWLRGMP